MVSDRSGGDRLESDAMEAFATKSTRVIDRFLLCCAKSYPSKPTHSSLIGTTFDAFTQPRFLFGDL